MFILGRNQQIEKRNATTAPQKQPTTVLCDPCSKCQSTEANVLPGKGPHAGTLRCARCDRFIKWLSADWVEALTQPALPNKEPKASQLSLSIGKPISAEQDDGATPASLRLRLSHNRFGRDRYWHICQLGRCFGGMFRADEAEFVLRQFKGCRSKIPPKLFGKVAQRALTLQAEQNQGESR